MLGKTATLSALMAAFLMAGGAMQPAHAQIGLPGVKSYNFTMPPLKLKRYCDRVWNGRYWKQKKRYGCDDISGAGSKKNRHAPLYRVDCHENQCVTTIVVIVHSGGDGDSRSEAAADSGAAGRGGQGGQGNNP